MDAPAVLGADEVLSLAMVQPIRVPFATSRSAAAGDFRRLRLAPSTSTSLSNVAMASRTEVHRGDDLAADQLLGRVVHGTARSSA